MSNSSFSALTRVVALALGSGLAACGGGSGGDAGTVPPPTATAPIVSIEGASASATGGSRTTVLEGAGAVAAPFTLRLSQPSSQPVTVQLRTMDQSAAAGRDYQPISSDLVIPAGTTAVALSVSVLSDTLFEAEETFLVRIQTASGATLGAAEAIGSIVDDDQPPVVSLAVSSQLIEGDAGLSQLPISVGLNGPSGLDTSVRLQVISDETTASAGSDFDFPAEGLLLTIPAGSTRASAINLAVLGDRVNEADETMTLGLAEAVNASIGGDGRGRTTLVDNDLPAPVIVARSPSDLNMEVTISPVANATGYEVYIAEVAGVRADNFQSLQGGRKLSSTGETVSTRFAEGGDKFAVAVASKNGFSSAASAEVSVTVAGPVAVPVTRRLADGAVVGRSFHGDVIFLDTGKGFRVSDSSLVDFEIPLEYQTPDDGKGGAFDALAGGALPISEDLRWYVYGEADVLNEVDSYFLKDRISGTALQIGAASTKDETPNSARSAGISADGGVAFHPEGVYFRNSATDSPRVHNYPSPLTVSDDGRYHAVRQNKVAGVYDVQDKVLVNFARTASGSGCGSSCSIQDILLSADGQQAIFTSNSTALVAVSGDPPYGFHATAAEGTRSSLPFRASGALASPSFEVFVSPLGLLYHLRKDIQKNFDLTGRKLIRVLDDGSLIFSTAEPLLAEDSDSAPDLYIVGPFFVD